MLAVRSRLPSPRRHLVRALPLLVLALSLAGCSRSGPDSAARPPGGSTLTVFAAASLREAFTALGGELQRRHPSVEVRFSFAGSQQLRTQLEHGAPADVFASADPQTLDALWKAGRVEAPQPFAVNEPVLVVARGVALRSLEELPRAGRIVVAAEEVPAGRYTRQILENAAARYGPGFRTRVEAQVASRELNVRQVLAKVSLGEADAGIVYRTDAAIAPDTVTVVPIPPALNVVAEYPVAAVAGSANPAMALAFIALVRSPAGQQVLRRHGFGPVAGSAAAADPEAGGAAR